MRTPERLRPLLFPLFSLGLCILAYGLLSPWLGLYWDDWALTWFAHEFGPGYFLDYAPYRPVSGWLYALSFTLLGENILAWQLYALLWRWLCVLALWQLLRSVLGKQSSLPQLAALIFALYPGFSQQPIAVTYSMYWLYFTVFLASLHFTVLSLRAQGHRWLNTLGALLSAATVMLSTEYFYGLELARGLLIWGVLGGQATAATAKRTLREWWPYLGLVVILFAWRSSVASQPGSLYSLQLLDQLLLQPVPTLAKLASTMLGDFVEAGLLAWARVFGVLPQITLGSLASMAYAGVVVLSLCLCWLALRQTTAAKEDAAVLLPFALGSLLVSGLSFWLADLPLRLSFAWDRFSLPLMLPVSLLLALLLTRAARWRNLLLGALCLVLALSSGYHFFNANQYREEWERQQSLFQQLVWRAPHIQPNTALLTINNVLEHYTDNSLVAPLNWIYSAEPVQERLPYFIAYLDIRADAELLGISGLPIQKTYRFNYFEGASSDVLVLYYQPPGCLRILNPAIDEHFPQLPQLLQTQATRSNLERIASQPEPAAGKLPYWAATPDNSWCFYFQKADLARQQGDWQEVVRLGEIAFALNDSPNHAAERTPFIEGYAHTGDWKRALLLSQEALRINRFMQPMLCALWQQLASDAPDTAGKSAALTDAEDAFACAILE